MGEFPWEILKSETLRTLSRELGIKRAPKREEIVAFLRSVQKKGLGPALAAQITKDLRVSGSARSHEVEINGHNGSSSSFSSPEPVSNKNPAPLVTPSRISTRKRPAPDGESDYTPLFLKSTSPSDEGENSDSGGRANAKESESISMVTRNRGTKRVRISSVEAQTARITRSRRDSAPAPTTVSAPVIRTSPRRKPVRPSIRSRTVRRISADVSEKRMTRNTRRKVPQVDERASSTDMDADGESEVVDDDEDVVEENSATGPNELVAALMKAGSETTSSRKRVGRPPKLTSAPSRTRATTSRPKPKPRPAVTLRIRQNNSVSDTRTLRRFIKPTAKGALLSPSKQAMTVLNRPLRFDAQRLAQVAKTSRKNELDFVVVPRASTSHSHTRGQNRSETPKEVFDGVVLRKRIHPARIVVNGDAGGSLPVQLDEFVANGLVGQRQNEIVDPVLERDDASSLGGSNKENDFLFRNVSEGSDAPEHPVPVGIGEEDAEGDPEHEANIVTQDNHQMALHPEAPAIPLQPQAELPMPVPYVENEFRQPLYEVQQPPQFEPLPDPISQTLPVPPLFEMQPGPLAEPLPQHLPLFHLEPQQEKLPEARPEPQSHLQSVPHLDLQSNLQPDPQVEPESESEIVVLPPPFI